MMSSVKLSLKHSIHNTAVSLSLGSFLSGVFWCELLPRVYYAAFFYCKSFTVYKIEWMFTGF